jgi:hypothetical protein
MKAPDATMTSAEATAPTMPALLRGTAAPAAEEEVAAPEVEVPDPLDEGDVALESTEASDEERLATALERLDATEDALAEMPDATEDALEEAEATAEPDPELEPDAEPEAEPEAGIVDVVSEPVRVATMVVEGKATVVVIVPKLEIEVMVAVPELTGLLPEKVTVLPVSTMANSSEKLGFWPEKLADRRISV